jgi:hypothetical protein
MTNFIRYTDAILSALTYSQRASELISKKQEVIDGVYQFHNFVPSKVLFVGFSTAILSCRAEEIFVTFISDEAQEYLKSQGVKFTYIPEFDLPKYNKKFEVTIALEEFFTFANSDADQHNTVKTICDTASEFVISTLKDYKNQDYKEREFSQPALIRNTGECKFFNEFHDWDMKDRTLWHSSIYEINVTENTMTSYGPFNRRTMYFKQLAKFSMDAGAQDFFVHKNLMYKSLIKKNYEHVVSIKTD